MEEPVKPDPRPRKKPKVRVPGPNGSRDNGAKSCEGAAKKMPKRAAAKKRKNASKGCQEEVCSNQGTEQDLRCAGSRSRAAAGAAAESLDG